MLRGNIVLVVSNCNDILGYALRYMYTGIYMREDHLLIITNLELKLIVS